MIRLNCCRLEDRCGALLPFLVFVLLILSVIPQCGYSQSGNLLSVDTLKRLSLEALMDVEVVSVSKFAEKLTQAASAIQVITQEDIRHSGATSVPEALRLAPNLEVAQVNASQWAITARGFNNVLANKLLVLIDGRVIYTPMYAGVFWDVQNLILEDIERIEVISGPGGTLWGANAVNGVINIITKNSKNTKGLYAEAAIGTTLRGLGSLRYGARIAKNLSFRIYGTSYRRGNTNFRDSVEANDDWQIAQAGVRLDWDATGRDIVMFQANVYDDRPDPDSGNPIVARGNNVIGRWNRAVSQRSDIQVQLYYDRTWRDFRNEFTEELQTYDIEGQHRLSLGKGGELIYGLGFRFMDHDVQNLVNFGFQPARKSLYLYNAFIQDEFPLIKDKLQLTAGIKVEHNTYTKFQYQPNVRLNWTATSRQTVWAAVSRAVRNPSRLDREFFIDLAPDFHFIVGGEFKSEEVLAYELGWRMQPAKEVSFSIATFYNSYDNLRSVEPGPPPFNLPLTYGNGVKGNTYGGELSATYIPTAWWRLRAGFTRLEKDLELKPGSGDLNNGSETNDPSHQLLLQSTMNLRYGLEFGAVVRYVDKLPKPYVSDYVGLDVRIAWKVAEVIELNVVGQNLVQGSHVEFVPSSEPSAKDILRSIYVKVACRL